MFRHCRFCGDRLPPLRWLVCFLYPQELVLMSRTCAGEPMEHRIRWHCQACVERMVQPGLP